MQTGKCGAREHSNPSLDFPLQKAKVLEKTPYLSLAASTDYSHAGITLEPVEPNRWPENPCRFGLLGLPSCILLSAPISSVTYRIGRLTKTPLDSRNQFWLSGLHLLINRVCRFHKLYGLFRFQHATG